jgi:hypothetical protein
VPTGKSAEANEQREELREELAGQTPKPLDATAREYDVMIDERMRTMARAERVFYEIEMARPRPRMHWSTLGGARPPR